MQKPTPELTRLLEQLEHYSQQVPEIRTTDWFSNNVFQCRSEKTCDYLQEIRDNLQKLFALPAQSDSRTYLTERIEMQLNAYIQAIMRAQKSRPGKQSRQRQTDPTTLHQLYQDLARHHGYEQQLSDNLQLALSADENDYDPEKIQRCRQRLQRCQQALAKIEEAIRQIEEY